ncbi:alpha/beta fold hydrolase [Bifidobacterium bombi]|uniref:alpha/beta fold hydrolase n=2 Tax=Bifidobacterium bombi TaxID=471511 RepID=UPI0006950928|nr:alpha/beta fold hydrolase [Bifidobacterium bombi]
MQMELIDEDADAYGQVMEGTVLPSLAKCRSDGWMDPAETPDLAVPVPVQAFQSDDVQGLDRGGRTCSSSLVSSDASFPSNSDGVSETFENAEGEAAGNIRMPDGSKPGIGRSSDGGGRSATFGKLHYIVYDAQRFDEVNALGASARFCGAVVISHGYTEFAEKYDELVWYFLLAGFSVCVLEHRGHGYSPRDVSDPALVWIDDWHRYVADLAKFAQSIGVAAAGEQPLYLYAHSMGAVIGSVVMEEYPDLFHRAVLNAPAFTPNTGIPRWMAFPATATAVQLGISKRRAPFQKDFDPNALDKGHAGAAPVRVEWYRRLRRNDRHYQTNAATFGHVCELLKMGDAAQAAEACSRIETPTLLFQAGHDVWTHEAGQFRFVERVRDGGSSIELVRYDTSCHEIFSMPNKILQRYLDEIFTFFASPADFAFDK